MEKGNGMEKKKVTTYSITSGLKDLIVKYLGITGISATTLYENAIIAFYKSEDWHIMDKLLITQKSNPEYVKRDVYERVYVNKTMSNMIDEIAAYNHHCSNSIVFFYAVLLYVSRGLADDNVLLYTGVRTGDTVLYQSVSDPLYSGKMAKILSFDMDKKKILLHFDDGKIIVADWNEVKISNSKVRNK